MLVHGQRGDPEALREEIARVLSPLGLRLSPAKTQIVHLSEGFDFLGFRIQWRRKQGASDWYIYSFISSRCIKAVKMKIRVLTCGTSQQDLGYVLTRINQVLGRWARYFRHAVAQYVFDMLDNFTWWRLIRMLYRRHHWRWKDIRHRFTTHTGQWLPIAAGEIEFNRIAAIPITRYRYRANKIPAPGLLPQPDGRDRPRARCAERRTAGSARGPGKRTGSNPGTAPRACPANPAFVACCL